MAGPLHFDAEAFLCSFPQYRSLDIAPGRLEALWYTADALSGCASKTGMMSAVPAARRRHLIHLVLSHLLTLEAGRSSSGGSAALSGRITSASEGSVSISVESFKADSLGAQWWSQTPDGTLYWMLTAPYRLGGRFYRSHQEHAWGCS